MVENMQEIQSECPFVYIRYSIVNQWLGKGKEGSPSKHSRLKLDQFSNAGSSSMLVQFLSHSEYLMCTYRVVMT